MEKRKKGNRRGATTVLVVCEGHTEEIIATREKNRRKSSGITILNMKGAGPEQIVEKAKAKFFEDGGYDKVFCIFDRDSHKFFAKALDKVQQLSSHKRGKKRIPIVAIISNPCIEVWIMCHFAIPKSNESESPRSIKAALKKYLPDYDKNDPAKLKKIESYQQEAIKNAKLLLIRNSDPFKKPFTNVHQFLELL